MPTATTGTEENVGDVYNGDQSRDVSEFMTHTGQGPDEYIWNGPTYDQTVATGLDRMRRRLYGDTAARDRLASDTVGEGIAGEPELD